MKWQGRKRSSNIEDRRGERGGGVGANRGTGPRLRMPGGRSAGTGGVGGLALVVVVVVISVALGVDPMQFLSGGTSTDPVPKVTRTNIPAANDDLTQFVGVVIQETEDLWGDVFAQNNLRYDPPTIVLYSERTSAAGCGVANASTGPFYCPADQNIYIDLTFYETLRSRFGAPGDFAQAYVLAHEVGHHVQQLTGVLPEFNAVRPRLSKEEANQWSVRVELQADCYAGVWANYAGQEDLLERGDIEEALNAASQIGDDTLQKNMQGFAVPKTFTHGTSEQRKRWFERGYAQGRVDQCDTFEAASL